MTNSKNKKLIAIISISIVLPCILIAFIIGKAANYDGDAETDDNTTSTTTIIPTTTSTITTTTTKTTTTTTITTTTTSTTTTTETSAATQPETTAITAKITTSAKSTAKATTPAPVTTTAKVTTTAINVEEYVNEIARLVNEERGKKGIAPVKLNAVLTDAAMLRAKEITTIFSHDRPDGRSCFSVFDDYNLSYSYAAENIAAGSSTPAGTMQQWIHSEGHYKNLMNPNVSEIGVGFFYDPNSPYRYYWVQIFKG